MKRNPNAHLGHVVLENSMGCSPWCDALELIYNDEGNLTTAILFDTYRFVEDNGESVFNNFYIWDEIELGKYDDYKIVVTANQLYTIAGKFARNELKAWPVDTNHTRKIAKEIKETLAGDKYSEGLNNFDAGDADNLLQIAAFGEVVYG